MYVYIYLLGQRTKTSRIGRIIHALLSVLSKSSICTLWSFPTDRLIPIWKWRHSNTLKLRPRAATLDRINELAGRFDLVHEWTWTRCRDIVRGGTYDIISRRPLGPC